MAVVRMMAQVCVFFSGQIAQCGKDNHTDRNQTLDHNPDKVVPVAGRQCSKHGQRDIGKDNGDSEKYPLVGS